MRKYTYWVSLKEFLKLFKCLASSGIHTVSGWLDLLFKALHQERKRRKERIPTRLTWAPSVVVILPLFIDIWYDFFIIKTLIIMSISTNIYHHGFSWPMKWINNWNRWFLLGCIKVFMIFSLNLWPYQVGMWVVDHVGCHLCW